MSGVDLLEVDLGADAGAAGIRAAFTTRAAGNLGLDVPDDPVAVRSRRARLRQWARAPIHFAEQVHGTGVLTPAATGPPPAAGSDPMGDAWWAKEPAALAVHAADCLPVLFFDAHTRIIGAAHAGRVGLLAGVLEHTVSAMRMGGAEAIEAVIGPAICGDCYEISSSMATDLAGAGVPVATSRWGTPALNLPAIARAVLTGCGVDVRDLHICTRTDERFFSHRSTDRSGGRHAGLIVRGP